MAKNDNQDGLYKRPTRGWSPKTNRIVGIIFIIFVFVCFIVRAFVGGNTEGNKSGTDNTGGQSVTTEAVTESGRRKPSDTNPEKSDNSVYYTFRNESTLESHYEKHGNEFSFSNASEYQDGANAVINDSDSLHKLEAEDGDDIYYLEASNEFVVVSTDGYIRTYFKPDKGKEYFDKQ